MCLCEFNFLIVSGRCIGSDIRTLRSIVFAQGATIVGLNIPVAEASSHDQNIFFRSKFQQNVPKTRVWGNKTQHGSKCLGLLPRTKILDPLLVMLFPTTATTSVCVHSLPSKTVREKTVVWPRLNEVNCQCNMACFRYLGLRGHHGVGKRQPELARVAETEPSAAGGEKGVDVAQCRLSALWRRAPVQRLRRQQVHARRAPLVRLMRGNKIIQGCLSASKPQILIIQVHLHLFAILIYDSPITNKV